MSIEIIQCRFMASNFYFTVQEQLVGMLCFEILEMIAARISNFSEACAGVLGEWQMKKSDVRNEERHL